MGNITDLDITGLISQKSGAPLGDAHELFSRAILMRLGFEVGKVDLSSSPFDIYTTCFITPGGQKTTLRTQVRTADNSVSFVIGGRGGKDRISIPGVKTHKLSTSDCDLILAIQKKTLDIYVIPTEFINRWGNTKALSKIILLKNNWDILLNWNPQYLSNLSVRL